MQNDYPIAWNVSKTQLSGFDGRFTRQFYDLSVCFVFLSTSLLWVFVYSPFHSNDYFPPLRFSPILILRLFLPILLSYSPPFLILPLSGTFGEILSIFSSFVSWRDFFLFANSFFYRNEFMYLFPSFSPFLPSIEIFFGKQWDLKIRIRKFPLSPPSCNWSHFMAPSEPL